MTLLPAGTQVFSEPVSDWDVVNKSYLEALLEGSSNAQDLIDAHNASVVNGETGPTISVRMGVRAAFVYWSGFAEEVSGHGYFQVQVATTPTFGTLINDVSTKSTWATFDGLNTGTIYYFRVRAIDAAGNIGNWADSINNTPPPVGSGDIGSGQVQTTHIANAAIGTAQIDDLAVTNAKISTLDASKINTGYLSAARVQAGSLSGFHLANGSIEAVKLVSDIQSDNFISGFSGWRIRRASGDAEFNNVQVRGTLSTAQSGTRVQMNASTATINFYSGSSLVGQIQPSSGYLRISGSSLWVDTGGQSIFQGGINASGYVVQAAVMTSSTFTASSYFSTASGSRFNPSFRFSSDTDTGIYRTQTNQLGIAAGGVLSAFFGMSTVAFPRTAGFTTGNSANMYISGTSTGSGGFVYRSTSSSRYKRDIRIKNADGRVLNINPSLYRGSQTNPKTGEKDWFEHESIGLIAEDVAEHFPEAAVFNEQGEPDAIEWNAITAALLGEVKVLRDRVAVLENAQDNGR